MTLAGASWIVGGLVVAALEMLAPGAFLLWIGMGALVAGLATELFGLGWHWQVGVFVAATLVLVAAVAPRLRRRRKPDAVNAPDAGLVGQTCRALLFRDGEGRVALGDGTWSARTVPAANPQPGDPLLVTGLDGTTLLVTVRA